MTAEASPSRQGSRELPPPPSGNPEPREPIRTAGPQLVPFCFWLPRSGAPFPAGGSADPGIPWGPPPDPAGLSSAISQHLAGLGWSGAAPLRWAITAVDPAKGLQLEGVGISDGATAKPGPTIVGGDSDGADGAVAG